MAGMQLGVGNPTDLFWCPIEGGDRRYDRLSAGRLGSLLSKVDPDRFDSESLLQCRGCETTFDSAVLDVLTNHEMVKRIDLAARALFGSLIRATPGDAVVKAAATAAMDGYLIRGVTNDVIDIDDIGDPLQKVAAVLSEDARHLLLERAIAASVSGGRIRARHLSVLVHAGDALGVSQRWIRSRIVERRQAS